MCPVIRELRKRNGFETTVCSTGQHREMLDRAMAAFDVKADVDLNVMRVGQSVSSVTGRILASVDALLAKERPDIVLVQGDTATAFAAAVSAYHRRIPVGHVEAGLRTYHMHSPFPEEFHRQAISMIADLHFAPTKVAKNNLLQEGKSEKRVFLTGNTVVDALRFSLGSGKGGGWRFPAGARVLVFTAHRRENFGTAMDGMFRALRRIVEAHPDVIAVCPLHPSPEVRRAAKENLAGCERIRAIEPPDTVRFHRLLAKSTLVLTDSGGIQEETTALGVPTVVMRYSTERSEGIRAGCLKLVGSGENGIVRAANRLLEPASEEYAAMKRPSRVFGDGHASERIVNVLERFLK